MGVPLESRHGHRLATCTLIGMSERFDVRLSPRADASGLGGSGLASVWSGCLAVVAAGGAEAFFRVAA